MEKYYVVSFSGGKDSTAMLLRLLELGYQIDEVVFCDTYKEFPQMYKHIERVQELVESKNIKFTTLKNQWTFDYWMYEYEPKRRNPDKFFSKAGADAKGLSWATYKTRWCSGELKIRLMDKYLKELKKTYEVIIYVGLAADEVKRLERKNNKNKLHSHPLVDWNWSEKDCLEYCYELGYDWDGLYEIFDRVSCWCCPLKSLEELRKLKKHFPDLWEELKDMDKRTWLTFRADYSVEELEIRFNYEEQRIKEGKSIRSREFYSSLRELLNRG